MQGNPRSITMKPPAFLSARASGLSVSLIRTAIIPIAVLLGCPAFAHGHDLTIRDTIGRDWTDEPIVWHLPGGTGDAVAVARDGKPIPAQVTAAEGGVDVLCIIDSLAKDGSTTLTARCGGGPA
jgi:hypothetical protein